MKTIVIPNLMASTIFFTICHCQIRCKKTRAADNGCARERNIFIFYLEPVDNALEKSLRGGNILVGHWLYGFAVVGIVLR